MIVSPLFDITIVISTIAVGLLLLFIFAMGCLKIRTAFNPHKNIWKRIQSTFIYIIIHVLQ